MLYYRVGGPAYCTETLLMNERVEIPAVPDYRTTGYAKAIEIAQNGTSLRGSLRNKASPRKSYCF